MLDSLPVLAQAPGHLVTPMFWDNGTTSAACSCGWEGTPIRRRLSPAEPATLEQAAADARGHIASAQGTTPQHALRLTCGCVVDLSVEELASTCFIHHPSPF